MDQIEKGRSRIPRVEAPEVLVEAVERKLRESEEWSSSLARREPLRWNVKHDSQQ